PAEKIRVIYNGLPEPFISQPKEPEPGALRRMGVASPFILFVGRLTPHKNVGALIRSFARLPADRRKGTQLVIAGNMAYDYPRLENAIVNALERVLSEPSLSQRLGKLGRERAQLFSAREAAQEHLKVYREALSA